MSWGRSLSNKRHNYLFSGLVFFHKIFSQFLIYAILWSYDRHNYECNFSNCVENPQLKRLVFQASLAFITVRMIASLDFISTVPQYMIHFMYYLVHRSKLVSVTPANTLPLKTSIMGQGQKPRELKTFKRPMSLTKSLENIHELVLGEVDKSSTQAIIGKYEEDLLQCVVHIDKFL